MKKQILLAAAVIFSAGMIFITGCKKDDTTGPVITITGSASEMSILNATWTDQGATAEDDEDGPVDVTVSGTVNKDLTGAYTITYTATDAAGNESTEDRTVTVYNEAKDWAGTYPTTSIVDSTFGNAAHTNYTGLFPWTNACTITASTTQNHVIIIDPFLNYSNIAASEKIMGTVTGTTLTIAQQTAHGIGASSHDHVFQGSGYVVATSPFKCRLVTSDHDNTTSGDAFDSVTYSK